MLLGKTIEGVWHTGLIINDVEYYYSGGICRDYKGNTPYGTPVKNLVIGATKKTNAEFMAWISSVSNEFTAEKYHLFYHNCNSFTNAAAIFLTGKGIPEYITNQH